MVFIYSSSEIRSRLVERFWLLCFFCLQKQRLQKKPHVFRSSAVADYSFLDNVHQGLFYKVCIHVRDTKGLNCTSNTSVCE